MKAFTGFIGRAVMQIRGFSTSRVLTKQQIDDNPELAQRLQN